MEMWLDGDVAGWRCGWMEMWLDGDVAGWRCGWMYPFPLTSFRQSSLLLEECTPLGQ